MKKILLSLGAMTAIAMPVVSIVACSEEAITKSGYMKETRASFQKEIKGMEISDDLKTKIDELNADGEVMVYYPKDDAQMQSIADKFAAGQFKMWDETGDTYDSDQARKTAYDNFYKSFTGITLKEEMGPSSKDSTYKKRIFIVMNNKVQSYCAYIEEHTDWK